MPAPAAPLPAGLTLARNLGATHELVWLTGRPAWLRSVTEAWLAAHKLPVTEVHLRPRGDARPAPAFKLGILRELAPRGVAAFVDDDPEVVDAARAAGFPAVLADWMPRSSTLRDIQDRLGRS